MERGDYLEKYWQAYPPSPRESGWIFGRFERQGADFLLHRLSHGRVPLTEALRFPLPDAIQIHATSTQLELSAHQFFGVLRSRDWVGFRPATSERQAEIILLSPHIEASPVKALTSQPFQLSEFRRQLREHFRDLQFAEVATPTLVRCPGTEVFLDVFSTEFSTGGRDSRSQQTYFLPTSPEIHLKKALALGVERLFELRPCFRNSEVSEKHRPEFWMLEWYRAFADLEDLKQDCRNLLREVTGRGDLVFSEVSVSELFSQLDLDLRPDTSVETLKEWCRRLGLSTQGYELWDDLFYLIFVDRIEAFLPSQQPLFVVDYPPSQAALARLNERGWADRFELYWRGFEIANAYFELNDPVEQRRRSQADLDARTRLGRQSLPLDEDFFSALRSGLPPSAGIALGVERLFMAARGLTDIKELSLWSDWES